MCIHFAHVLLLMHLYTAHLPAMILHSRVFASLCRICLFKTLIMAITRDEINTQHHGIEDAQKHPAIYLEDEDKIRLGEWLWEKTHTGKVGKWLVLGAKVLGTYQCVAYSEDSRFWRLCDCRLSQYKPKNRDHV